jgi:hypothetical protein
LGPLGPLGEAPGPQGGAPALALADLRGKFFSPARAIAAPIVPFSGSARISPRAWVPLAPYPYFKRGRRLLPLVPRQWRGKAHRPRPALARAPRPKPGARLPRLFRPSPAPARSLKGSARHGAQTPLSLNAPLFNSSAPPRLGKLARPFASARGL